VTWTRVATDGCVDRFEPYGTATLALGDGCTDVTPSWHGVEPADGALELDRSVNPPAFRITGATLWEATQTCPDRTGGSGLVTTVAEVGGPWALYSGVYDGDAFSASSVFPWYPRFAWSLKRLP
jgi:hypothetical protein